MNGIHDMGGMDGFGPVATDEDHAVFSEQWERESFAVLVAALSQGLANSDENRSIREQIDPLTYLSTSYFEHWLVMMETQLVSKGVITEQERLQRVRDVMRSPDRFPPAPVGQAPDELAQRLLAGLAAGGPVNREVDIPPEFAVGDFVRTSQASPAGHTRLPRYARGKLGVVTASHGAHVFPDTNAHGLGENPHHLYTVRFEGDELWGDHRTGEAVHLDLWEPYLTPSDAIDQVKGTP